MCIATWALDYQEYSLILCTNRDELLSRPTQDAHFHNFEKDEAGSITGNILSGRDEKAGGTWFGVNRAGKVALLTNITEPKKNYPFSRGHLVSSFLLLDPFCPLEAEVGRIIPQDSIGGFNLLLLAPASRPDGSLHFDSLLVTNHGAGGTVSSRPLSYEEKFCGCISNAVDGTTPPWPKVDHAPREFSSVLRRLSPSMSEAELTDNLFELLSWRSPQPVTTGFDLRNTVHVAPVPITQEESLTPGSNLYATRLSTVLLVKKSGEALFIERDIWQLEDGKAVKADLQSQRTFRFQISPRRPET
ncbi:hypothetical protein L208DRAFT_1404484 [Tricholoma matsutake]|nr:hypothetical protein L208DRAFT_1404484 [Tricholoma matsutake 945]